MKYRCPECGEQLTKKPGLGESVFECTGCLCRWGIIKTSDGAKRRSNQVSEIKTK